MWGPGSSEGAGAAATKASSTPGPCTPPPGPPPPSPALLPVALQQALGEAPCGQALGAGLGAVLLLAVLKVLDDVPHVAGLDWKRGDNEGRPPPAGSALQPRPRTGTEAPGTRGERLQPPPGPRSAAPGTALPGPCPSAPAPPRPQSGRAQKCVSRAGAFRLSRSLLRLFCSEIVTRLFPRATYKLKQPEGPKTHLRATWPRRQARSEFASPSEFPRFSRAPSRSRPRAPTWPPSLRSRGFYCRRGLGRRALPGTQSPAPFPGRERGSRSGLEQCTGLAGARGGRGAGPPGGCVRASGRGAAVTPVWRPGPHVPAPG